MRIITGTAKGLKLKTPKGFSTRPTSDRIKESIFSILNGLIDFSEVEVLDIFAGTGALGIESLSRGAKNATFIDFSTADLIFENLQHAKFQNFKILRDDFSKCLKKLSAQNLKFDLIFSDPPYKKNLATESINLVSKLNLLTAEGLMVVEYGADEIIESDSLNCIRKINYGHTTSISIYQKKGSEP
jgi:16S rRNA (guanine(966)-N(2))-methyltransferase RsmD